MMVIFPIDDYLFSPFCQANSGLHQLNIPAAHRNFNHIKHIDTRKTASLTPRPFPEDRTFIRRLVRRQHRINADASFFAVHSFYE